MSSGLSEPSRGLLGRMLEREEEWAHDYRQDPDDWREWADEIDVLRHEVGLPLLLRGPEARPMTYREWVDCVIADNQT